MRRVTDWIVGPATHSKPINILQEIAGAVKRMVAPDGLSAPRSLARRRRKQAPRQTRKRSRRRPAGSAAEVNGLTAMRALWTPVFLLLRLRWRLRLRALARSSATQLGVALALVVFVPAANAAGIACYHQLRTLPPAQAVGMLRTYLFGVQGIWLAALLLAGGAGAAASRAADPRRFLPVRSGQAVGAATLGGLTDLPLLLALPLFVAVTRAFGAGQPPAGMIVVGGTLALFALQSAASAALLEQVAVVLRGWRLPAALALGGIAAWAAAPLLPPAAAARAVGASERGEWGTAALWLALLGAQTFLWIGGAARLRDTGAREPGMSSGRRATTRPAAVSVPADAAKRGAFPPTPLELAADVARMEWHLLIRNPGRHLPLRGPAMMCLLCGFLWIAPNLGDDALRNAQDLAGMGGLLYALLWQAQLLCDRFGTETGTAALLLSLPLDRCLLLLGRNAALLALLLAVDSMLLGVVCLAAHPASWLAGALFAWLPALLTLGTTLGNLTATAHPFPLAARGAEMLPEPEISVALDYFLLGALSAGLIWLCTAAVGSVLAAPLVGLAVAGGLYAATLPVAARQLLRREPRLIRALDGRG